MAHALLRNARGIVEWLTYRVEIDDALLAFYLDATHDDILVELLVLLRGLGFNFAVADGLLLLRASTAERYLGAALDIGIVGRGLIYPSLELAILLGVVDDETHVREIREMLAAEHIPPGLLVVAYLDYLGVSEGEVTDSVAETFATIGRTLAARTGRYCYYWTASDTYCLSVSLDHEQSKREEQVTQFLLELLEIQARHWIGDKSWMWQIGVTVGEAPRAGDMVLPAKATMRAASLMKRAYLPKNGGGLILCDAGVFTTGVLSRLRAAMAGMERPPRIMVHGTTTDLEMVDLREVELGEGQEIIAQPSDTNYLSARAERLADKPRPTQSAALRLDQHTEQTNA